MGYEWAMRDSNPRPSRCKRDGTTSQDLTPQDLTSTPSAACTAACTSKPENANAGTPEAGHQDQGEGTAAATLDADPQGRPTEDQGQSEGTDQGGTARRSSAADQGDPLAKLAAALLDLTPADRARLAAMLNTPPAIRGDAVESGQEDATHA